MGDVWEEVLPSGSGKYELRIDWELLKGGEGECGGVDVGEMWCMCGG